MHVRPAPAAGIHCRALCAAEQDDTAWKDAARQGEVPIASASAVSRRRKLRE